MAIKKLSKTARKNKIPIEDFPPYCDFLCPFASFPSPDTVGACRREQAVYCLYVKKYNNKNNTCLVRL